MSTFAGRLNREPFLERHHFLTFVAVAGLGLGLTTLSVRQPERVRGVQAIGLTVMGPVAKAGAGISGAAGDAWGGVRSTWSARKDLAALQVEVDTLRLASSERDALATENARLRDLLDLKLQVPRKLVAARVVYQERGPDWILLIDQGSEQGIAEDQAVIAPAGVVGKVLQVDEGMARVQCVVDGSAGIAVRVGPQGRTSNAIVTDGSGDTCRLRHVDLLEDVQPGDPVVTSGLDLVYPSGLLVGEVVSLEEPGIDREIVVRPAVDFSNLDHVLVIVSSDEATRKARKERAASQARPPAREKAGSGT